MSISSIMNGGIAGAAGDTWAGSAVVVGGDQKFRKRIK
jgi:hypothetical protein